jgi:hypothetical protein
MDPFDRAHPPGTILAFYDTLNEVWSFKVIGCACVGPSGTPVKRHTQLGAAEECARKVIVRDRHPRVLAQAHASS